LFLVFLPTFFKNNALNNGLLPVQVSEEFLRSLFEKIEENKDTQVKIDLDAQTILIGEELEDHFEINAYKKLCLVNGYDDIDFLLSKKSEIEQFELSNRYSTN